MIDKCDGTKQSILQREELENFRRSVIDCETTRNKIELDDQMNCLAQVGLIQPNLLYEEQPSGYLGLCQRQQLKLFNDVPCVKFFKDQEADIGIGEEKSFIDVGQIRYEKKVFVIYNPASGRRIDIRAHIQNVFFSNGIDYDFHETKGSLDALRTAMNFDIDNYSALILVGGDGTFHEAINGLMRRPDNKKIPIGLIPNGSGDDICGQIGIDPGDSDTAMDYIVKGDTIKIDVIKVLLDHENENEIKITVNKDDKKDAARIEDFLRYEIINCSYGLISNCARHAAPMKPYLGKQAYTLQAVIELFKKRTETFDVYIDQQSFNGHSTKSQRNNDQFGSKNITENKESKESMVLVNKNLTTQLLLAYNGKFGGGREMLSPPSVINDGVFEVYFSDQPVSTPKLLNTFQQAKTGGAHFYEELATLYKVKKLRLENKSTKDVSSASEDSMKIQDVNVDGEDLQFQKFVKMECVHNCLELIVNFSSMFKKFYPSAK